MSPDELETVTNSLHAVASRWRECAARCQDPIAAYLYRAAADQMDAAGERAVRAIHSAHRAEHNEKTRTER